MSIAAMGEVLAISGWSSNLGNVVLARAFRSASLPFLSLLAEQFDGLLSLAAGVVIDH